MSELVTNVLLHAVTPMSIALSVAGGTAEVSVRDRDPRPPVVRPVRLDLIADVDTLSMTLPDLERDADRDPRHPSLRVGPSGSITAGRGMLIVDAVADEWGVADRADGKDVWFRVPVRSAWPHAPTCPCDGVEAATPAGMRVVHVAGPWDEPAG